VVGAQKCQAGGIYTIPRGNALIITGATFFERRLTALPTR
jgi:hypothetical protein